MKVATERIATLKRGRGGFGCQQKRCFLKLRKDADRKRFFCSNVSTLLSMILFSYLFCFILLIRAFISAGNHMASFFKIKWYGSIRLISLERNSAVQINPKHSTGNSTQMVNALRRKTDGLFFFFFFFLRFYVAYVWWLHNRHVNIKSNCSRLFDFHSKFDGNPHFLRSFQRNSDVSNLI